jgi:TonB family protein
VPRSDGGLIALPAKDKPAPGSDGPKEDCFAPAGGLYAPRPLLSPELQEVQHRYSSLAVQHLGTTWFRGMPRAANDPWVKAAKVTVRFAILKDGSIDTPRVTVSSGRESFDKHALEALYKTVPFDPLPEGIGAALPICMTFGYNQQEDQWKKPIDLWPTKPAGIAAPPPAQ